MNPWTSAPGGSELEPPAARRIGLRAVRSGLGGILEDVAAGERVVVCRRTKPLAVLIPMQDLQRLYELTRRDAELAAVLRGRGHVVDPWTTPEILEVVVSYLGRRSDATSRSEPRGPEEVD